MTSESTTTPMPAKWAVDTSTADAINQHHRAAQSHATKALDHAKQAGELLIKVKSTIGHGGWLNWLRHNCEVSARQAQRYMSAAAGRYTSLSLIAKNDIASHLQPPGFVPTPGHWMLTTTNEAEFHVMPALEHHGYFHVSRLNVSERDCFYSGTKLPILAIAVEITLQHLGLQEPAKVEWRSTAHTGLARPLGEEAQ